MLYLLFSIYKLTLEEILIKNITTISYSSYASQIASRIYTSWK